MSWQQLEDGDPGLAAFGAQRLVDPGVAYLSTVDRDGAPRVHPVTPIVAPKHLFVFMEPTSPKGHDLERGSGYALHCAVDNQAGGRGEFRVRGSGQRITDPALRQVAADHAPYEPADHYVLYELLVDDAFSTTYTDGAAPLRKSWVSGGRTPGERS